MSSELDREDEPSDASHQSNEREDPTEFLIRKKGENLVISAVVDGRQIFYMEPRAEFARKPITAGIQAWFGRAFGDMLREKYQEPDEISKGGFM